MFLINIILTLDMVETRLYRERLARVIRYSLENSPKLPYHNFQHEREVANAAVRLGELEGVSDERLNLLQAAAYLHDVVFVLDAKDNEEKSAAVASRILGEYGYFVEEISAIKGMILATKIPSNPKNLLEKIMCDADLDNLGTEAFFEKDKLLRTERGLESADNALEWYLRSLDFLNSHKYYTESAKKLRNEGLAKNMAAVGEIIMRFPK